MYIPLAILDESATKCTRSRRRDLAKQILQFHARLDKRNFTSRDFTVDNRTYARCVEDIAI